MELTVDLASLFVTLGFLIVDLAFDSHILLGNATPVQIARAHSYYAGLASSPYNIVQGFVVTLIMATLFLVSFCDFPPWLVRD